MGRADADKLIAEARRARQDKDRSYRARALKMFPWICGVCGREFDQRNIQQLTVHHKDHNHDNNPADGSNWELLCIYCHDNEHSRDQVAAATVPGSPQQDKPGTYQPFKDLLNTEE